MISFQYFCCVLLFVVLRNFPPQVVKGSMTRNIYWHWDYETHQCVRWPGELQGFTCRSRNKQLLPSSETVQENLHGRIYSSSLTNLSLSNLSHERLQRRIIRSGFPRARWDGKTLLFPSGCCTCEAAVLITASICCAFAPFFSLLSIVNYSLCCVLFFPSILSLFPWVTQSARCCDPGPKYFYRQTPCLWFSHQ